MSRRAKVHTFETFPWSRLTLDPTRPECWTWGGCRSNGYGRLGTAWAHRVVWTIMRGDIPKGLHIDHLCRNRACVNPWHLEPVTQRGNTLRGEGRSAVAVRTNRCQRGHAFAGENLYVTPTGTRQCRACRAEAMQRFYVRRALSEIDTTARFTAITV